MSINIQSEAEPYIKHYMISGQDLTRPWGGFYYIDNKDLNKFVMEYFRGVVVNTKMQISPKILVISPRKRLSWQYHNRRREIWSVLVGPVGIIRSNTDREGDMNVANAGDIIIIEQEERHRIVGLDTYAVVAELWCHTNLDNPSDESDIIRLQDDFKR